MKHIIKVEVLQNLPKTRPLIAMDAGGNLAIASKQDGTKIWYTTIDNEKYDLGEIIKNLSSMGATYNGPAVISNEYDEEKQMFCMTFDDDVTVLGDVNTKAMTIDGPFFATNPNYGLECNVETIILPKTTTRIGGWAFFECHGLTSIEIPNNVTIIGAQAFHGCKGLKSIEIPNSVTSIVWEAFAYCRRLTSVICEAIMPPTLFENDVFDYTNNCPIYVPAGSVDAYKAAEYWTEYADRIYAISE